MGTSRRTDKPPTYSVGDYLIGAVNLVHYGAAFLAILSAVTGVLMLRFARGVGVALLGFAALLLLVQLVSRVRHLRSLDRIRYVRGTVQFRSDEAGAWVSEDRVERIASKRFLYADAWRPITLGYPGIEVKLSGIREPVELLYPPGFEELRDRMFAYLSRRHPNDIVESEQDE